MTLPTVGALAEPQLPATASNVCTTDARLGGVGRVPPNKKSSATKEAEVVALQMEHTCDSCFRPFPGDIELAKGPRLALVTAGYPPPPPPPVEAHLLDAEREFYPLCFAERLHHFQDVYQRGSQVGYRLFPGLCQCVGFF